MITARTLLRAFLALSAGVVLGLIWLYQKTLSPVLPALCGPSCGCRFYPTCSHYAQQAVREHGLITGAWLALGRLARCTPLHPGGLDPVPSRRAGAERRQPACTRVSSLSEPSFNG